MIEGESMLSTIDEERRMRWVCFSSLVGETIRRDVNMEGERRGKRT